MASAITHFVVGAALALPAAGSASLARVMPAWAIPLTAGMLAVAPDLDTYGMRALQVPHGSLFGHRGFFHSAAFLIAFGSGLALAAARSWPAAGWLALTWSACALTHPLLDMLTDGGLGVMLWFPFSNDRLFFPWHPIHVSPLGIARFFSRAGYILKSELPFCAASLAIGIGGFVARRAAR